MILEACHNCGIVRVKEWYQGVKRGLNTCPTCGAINSLKELDITVNQKSTEKKQ
jgi:hypothetical protein